MIDKEVKFALFGSNNDGSVGVKTVEKDGQCPIFGLVAFKWDDCLMNVKPTVDQEGLQNGIMVIKASELRRVGFDLGSWEFGFLGDVTPEDDKELVFIVTDSGHLVWVHTNVE